MVNIEDSFDAETELDEKVNQQEEGPMTPKITVQEVFLVKVREDLIRHVLYKELLYRYIERFELREKYEYVRIHN